MIQFATPGAAALLAWTGEDLVKVLAEESDQRSA